ncbi:L,D-transpeptidase family protein [Bacillus mangrovi]|uniref:L,D-transpeptidase family protein n=1 Tax=Metabacillus mangrovi TaxID=1491830 RepID=A0A7X2S6Y7_9BACI|nr:L,D-transpeptidase family protein [Metabacillus mangrovi]
MKKLACCLLLFCILVCGFSPPASAGSNQLLIINKSINKLAFFENGKLVRVFSVATGRKDSYTPEGTFPIVSKIVNRPYYKQNIPGGSPRNPLGDRWLGLNARGTYGTTYAIHGNNDERSIGKYVSSGCVRMYNNEVRWLYPRVNKMTKVVILKSKDSFETIARKKGYKLNEDSIKQTAAVQQGKLLAGKTAEYQKAINSGSISKVNSLYDGFTKQIKTAEASIGKVSVKSVRDGLGKQYVLPAKKSLERSMYEVSQYRLMPRIKTTIQARKLTQADTELSQLDRLQTQAVRIKKERGYAAIPSGIKGALEKQEAELYGMLAKTRTADYSKVIASTSIYSLDRAYNPFLSYISRAEREINEVSHQESRKNLLESSIKPAKISLDRTKYQVSMHRQMNKVHSLLQNKKTADAKKEFEVLDRLKSRLPANDPVLKPVNSRLVNRYTELKKKLL